MRLCVEQTDDNDPGKLITIVQDGVYKYCLNVDCINDLPSITFKESGSKRKSKRKILTSIFVR